MRGQGNITLIKMFVAIIMIAILAALVWWTATQPQQEKQYERKNIEGVECLYDNYNQKVLDCEWDR